MTALARVASPVANSLVRQLASAFAALCVVAGAGALDRAAANPVAAACRPLQDRFDIPGLWLGHFSGGRRLPSPYGEQVVDWTDQHQCFVTAADCRAWRRTMRRAYHSVEGYSTCIALRGGGKTRVHVIRARY